MDDPLQRSRKRLTSVTGALTVRELPPAWRLRPVSLVILHLD